MKVSFGGAAKLLKVHDARNKKCCQWVHVGGESLFGMCQVWVNLPSPAASSKTIARNGDRDACDCLLIVREEIAQWQRSS